MNNEEKEAFLSTLDKMAEKQKNTGKEMFVGVNRVLSDAESKSFFEENRTQYPKMDIKIPFLTVRETLLYKPALNASQVMCPTLIVIAGQDTVNPPEQGRALFDAVGAKEKGYMRKAVPAITTFMQESTLSRLSAFRQNGLKRTCNFR